MDHDSLSGSSGSDLDTEDDRNSRESTSATREKSTTTTRRSMRGLQIAIAEGWLVQRARDMCSFAHDRYRQAAEAEALSLPSDLIAKMSFRVRSFRQPLLLSHYRRVHLIDHLNDAPRAFPRRLSNRRARPAVCTCLIFLRFSYL